MRRVGAAREALDALVDGFDYAGRRARDPVAFVHRYPDEADRELVSLFAALMAYGRVSLIERALEEVCRRMGPRPAEAAARDDEPAARARFGGFVYRLTRGEDLARLWLGIAQLQRAYGSLRAAFLAFDQPAAPDLRPALRGFRAALLAPTDHFPYRRAFEHLFPDPGKGSAIKRPCLWLRWLVRGPDDVDLGLWRELGPSRLTIPLDTHVHRIARYLGLTSRAQADWRTAAEITASLRRLSPEDPLRYDFVLSHLGISGACPTRRAPAVCDGCDIRDICGLDTDGRVRATLVR